ncbi:unnamed protein product [Rotaria magnacalcarata]|uniref:Uncharacterized protein n=1 Tax=Rotaria magnacalcarata TaxID=392030 RepID=A0A816URY4_9BILA|nr:unnamed protein product [Rotaria magnacalcarata]CAF2128776.1 unnamed protein product [Rotaria magnacalcarata]CAF3929649.1 unnamed protein product [Rotaria magnacalcarata]CAF4006864.1 unnamed protein product [Rotaria magnacalcarata]
MTSKKLDKNDLEQVILFLNEQQDFVGHASKSAATNNAIDIAILNNDEADRPDPLRLPEVIIVICVLLLWCGSIFSFIRHSELLRIRHRDLPYRSNMKPPMNLNHITVVHRTSDMVIHSKPRRSSALGLPSSVYNHKTNKYNKIESTLPARLHFFPKVQHSYSYNSNNSIAKHPCHDEQFLNPSMISHDVRRSLLDLHYKSMDNLSAMKHTMSYSTTDVSRRKQNDACRTTIDERTVQESPV